MFFEFFAELRNRGVKVGAHEAVALAGALMRGLHDSSLDGFYHVARALCVHSEAQLDAFDRAFLSHFRGVATQSLDLTRELLEWLKDAKTRQLSAEERAILESLDLEELKRQFEERLREQKERHDGGNRWIGTGGTSPFGHSGAARAGIRVGGPGGNRSAVKLAEARQYAGYRSDVVLDVRQMSVALRKLRAFAREGTEQELNLEETIAATAKNAGELEVVTQPPRRPNTRVVLMMDVGGSMDPYSHLVSRLFSAASKATHFKALRTYYFHNCIYGRVYQSENMGTSVALKDVLAECGKHYKLIIVGDALMAPYELFMQGGALGYADPEGAPGVAWLLELAQHFDRSAWLNPEPLPMWNHPTISEVRRVFPMFPLTLEGLGDAVGHLTRHGISHQ